MSAIRFQNVSKRFVLHHQKARSFQDLLVSRFKRRADANGVEEFWALRDVSFEVPGGQMVGLIGANGAGKSTILKLIARIYEPTRGKVRIAGRLNALIELSAGFHEDLTGRENVYLSAALLGLSRREIKSHFDEIVAFSELEKFIDTPVKHYSTGMHMRLGFAIATCIESEILLVDEVMAVGDANFQRKCFERIAEIREHGTTIFLVSHQMAQIERYCDRALLLREGQLIADGAPTTATQQYGAMKAQQQREGAEFFSAAYLAYEVPAELRVGERAFMTVTLRNTSRAVWNGASGAGTRLVSLSYHWLDAMGNVHQFVGPRLHLPHDLPPGEAITLKTLVLPPNLPGQYRLEVDLCAEGEGWFAAHAQPGPQLKVQVLAAGSALPGGLASGSIPVSTIPASSAPTNFVNPGAPRRNGDAAAASPSLPASPTESAPMFKPPRVQ